MTISSELALELEAAEARHREELQAYKLTLPDPDTHCLDDDAHPPVDVWSYSPGLVRQIIESDRTQRGEPASEFPVNWASMIHYPECWDTAAYPELRDAIHEVLAWSVCSVCNPQPERKPMTGRDIIALSLRLNPLATSINERDLRVIRETEHHHGITEKP